MGSTHIHSDATRPPSLLLWSTACSPRRGMLMGFIIKAWQSTVMCLWWTSRQGSGSSLPLIFCIHVHSGPIYWGSHWPCKKIIRWWNFTCKKSENIICDGILHVNMFHYFKILYFTCTFFTKFTYNEYIGPYFLSHVVLRFSSVNSLRDKEHWWILQ
jgi:hypothetical protein